SRSSNSRPQIGIDTKTSSASDCGCLNPPQARRSSVPHSTPTRRARQIETLGERKGTAAYRGGLRPEEATPIREKGRCMGRQGRDNGKGTFEDQMLPGRAGTCRNVPPATTRPRGGNKITKRDVQHWHNPGCPLDCLSRHDADG